MTNVSEHDSKQEWEGHTCEETWVNFLVIWDTVCVNDLLESICELVSSEQGWLGKTWDLGWTYLILETRQSFLFDNILNLILKLEIRWSPNESSKDHVVLF